MLVTRMNRTAWIANRCATPVFRYHSMGDSTAVGSNGVSLTINQVNASTLTVGLIPETMKRTNLGQFKVGDAINLEIDNMARGLVNWARVQQESL